MFPRVLTSYGFVNNQCRLLYPVSRHFGKINPTVHQQAKPQHRLAQFHSNRIASMKITDQSKLLSKNKNMDPDKMMNSLKTSAEEMQQKLMHTLRVIKNSETTQRLMVLGQEMGGIMYCEGKRLLIQLWHKLREIDYKTHIVNTYYTIKYSNELKYLKKEAIRLLMAFIRWSKATIEDIRCTYFNKK